jgi:hypothetical protein
MGFVDKSDRMINRYGIARRTWKWTKKLFFHLTDMTILNAFFIHKVCGGKMMHKNFGKWLSIHKRKMWQLVAFQGADQVQMRCRVCSLHKQTWSTLYFCRKWDVGLCVALQQEVAYVCDSPLHTQRCVEWVNMRQIISLYSTERKHLPCKWVLYTRMYITSHMPAV